MNTAKKDILLATNIYYIYLEIEGLKTVEVRKILPSAFRWRYNQRIILYATKSTRDLKRIPAEKRERYRKLLGKIVGEFYCDGFSSVFVDTLEKAHEYNNPEVTGMTDDELVRYAHIGKAVHFLNIPSLKTYDKPKELNEFYRPCNGMDWDECGGCDYLQSETHPGRYVEFCGVHGKRPLDRPPQSWCYVEEFTKET